MSIFPNKNLGFQWFLISFLVSPLVSVPTPGENVSKVLDSLLEGYDKRVRPNYGGEAVEVGVTMYILGVSSFSDKEMEWTFDMYFRQSWKDQRLNFRGRLVGQNIVLRGADGLWLPDTFFVNEKKTYFHTATVSNEFLRISENGDVLRSFRLTVTASCPMDLRYFPMDRQLCTLEIESFGHTMSDIRYKWAKGDDSVGISSDVSLPEFKVLGHKQQQMEILLSTGNYSRLACEVQFVRSAGYYIIGPYLLSALSVIVSWVSFWLNRKDVTARIIITLTGLVSTSILLYVTNSALPKISYVKAIDVYLGFCVLMTFITILVSATVTYLTKQIDMRQASDTEYSTNQKEMAMKYSVVPAWIDKVSRVLFPSVFLFFNAIYMLYYCNASSIVEDDLILLE